MFHRSLTAPILALSLAACADKDSGTFPHGGGSGTDGDGGANPGQCTGSDLAFVGDVLVEPMACLAFSPRIDGVDWHATVSAAEAEAGGCGTVCDDDETDTCATLGDVDGFTGWRSPTAEELEDLSLLSPPYDDDSLGGSLWTLETGSFDPSLALVVDLGQPGMSVQIDKTASLAARCVTDAD